MPSVGGIGMAAASDAEIMARAADLERTIATLDADFHDLLAHSGASRPSVLRIREEGLKAPELSHLILTIAARFHVELAAGCVMTYRSGNIRFRKLPLV